MPTENEIFGLLGDSEIDNIQLENVAGAFETEDPRTVGPKKPGRKRKEPPIQDLETSQIATPTKRSSRLAASAAVVAVAEQAQKENVPPGPEGDYMQQQLEQQQTEEAMYNSLIQQNESSAVPTADSQQPPATPAPPAESAESADVPPVEPSAEQSAEQTAEEPNTSLTQPHHDQQQPSQPGGEMENLGYDQSEPGQQMANLGWDQGAPTPGPPASMGAPTPYRYVHCFLTRCILVFKFCFEVLTLVFPFFQLITACWCLRLIKIFTSIKNEPISEYLRV